MGKQGVLATVALTLVVTCAVVVWRTHDGARREHDLARDRELELLKQLSSAEHAANDGKTVAALSPQWGERASACQTSDDCAITCAVDGQCCVRVCNCSTAYSADFVRALGDQRAQSCGDVQCPHARCVPRCFGGGESRPGAACAHPKPQMRAVCDQGTCRAEQPWLDWPTARLEGTRRAGKMNETTLKDALGTVLRLGWSWTEGHAELVLRQVPSVVLAEAAAETPSTLAMELRSLESRGSEVGASRPSGLLHALISSPWVQASIEPSPGAQAKDSVDVHWRADWWKLRAPPHEQRVCFRAGESACPAKPPTGVAHCGPCAIAPDTAATERERASRPDACCYTVSSPPPPKGWGGR